jgi:hypothetical protein
MEQIKNLEKLNFFTKPLRENFELPQLEEKILVHTRE